MATVALVMGGCLFAEPETAGITITNESRAELNIFVEDATRPEATVSPGVTQRKATSGLAGTCVDWLLTARTADGTEVATLGPRVCDGDEWVITQEDVDAAVESG